jgi:hypothetical protein
MTVIDKCTMSRQGMLGSVIRPSPILSERRYCLFYKIVDNDISFITIKL